MVRNGDAPASGRKLLAKRVDSFLAAAVLELYQQPLPMPPLLVN